MARSSEALTTNEVAAYEQFCANHNIVHGESEDGIKNGNLLGGYVAFTLNEDITEQTLAQALEKLRPQVIFLTPAQLVAKAAGVDQHQADVVVSILSRRQIDQRYLVEDAVTVAKYILSQNWALGPYSVDLALSNLGSTPGGAKVHWVRKLQDREREELARREANRQDLEEQRKNKTTDGVPNWVPAHLKEWYRNQHRPTDKPAAPAGNDEYWQSRAESVHLDVRSNLKAQELQRMFVMNPGSTKVDWQATFTARRQECDRYKNRGGL